MSFNTSTSQTSLLPISTFNHMVIMELKRDNYLLWATQLFPFLRSQRLMGNIDGSIVQPSATVIIHDVETP